MHRAIYRAMVSIICISLLGGFTPEEKERSHGIAISARDAYWECLAQETVKYLKSSISAQDFKLLLEGACPDQKQAFRVKLIDYLAMMHPDIPTQTHLSQADYTMSAAQADAVSALIKMRAESK